MNLPLPCYSLTNILKVILKCIYHTSKNNPKFKKEKTTHKIKKPHIN